jgi:hypothetical protein
MPYYSEGRIDFWKWSRANFDVMKNVMKHVCLSLFVAKKSLGFIHFDLHLGNILLKRSTRTQIKYDNFGQLDVLGVLPIIMDFEKSHFVNGHDNFTYEDLINFISLMSNSCDVKFDGNPIISLLESLINKRTDINSEISDSICKMIDNLQIRSVYSERSPLPDWLQGCDS